MIVLRRVASSGVSAPLELHELSTCRLSGQWLRRTSCRTSDHQEGNGRSSKARALHSTPEDVCAKAAFVSTTMSHMIYIGLALAGTMVMNMVLAVKRQLETLAVAMLWLTAYSWLLRLPSEVR